MGTTWAVVPELLALTNPEQVPLYARHPNAATFAEWRQQFRIPSVTEIWVITTNGDLVLPERRNLDEWACLAGVSVRQISHPRLVELAHVEECRFMTELIYRAVLYAQDSVAGGAVLLSLAGGRKTMSADIQQAAHIFGCQALLHVVDNGKTPKFQPENLREPLLPEIAETVSPIMICGTIQASHILHAAAPDRIMALNFPITEFQATTLLNTVERRQQNAAALLFNYRRQLIGGERTNFRQLYALAPEVIEKLQTQNIGVCQETSTADLAWLRQLPKAELHCHLGGILSPAEMLEVAAAEAAAVCELRKTNPDLNQWLSHVRKLVKNSDLPGLKQELQGSGKALRPPLEVILTNSPSLVKRALLPSLSQRS